MEKLKKVSKALLIGSVLTFGGLTAVSSNFTTAEAAESGYVDSGDYKGYWIRGKIDGNVHSEYKNYKQQGRSTVVNGAGTKKESGWKEPNVYALTKADWTFWGVNKAYYGFQAAE